MWEWSRILQYCQSHQRPDWNFLYPRVAEYVRAAILAGEGPKVLRDRIALLCPPQWIKQKLDRECDYANRAKTLSSRGGRQMYRRVTSTPEGATGDGDGIREDDCLF